MKKRTVILICGAVLAAICVLVTAACFLVSAIWQKYVVERGEAYFAETFAFAIEGEDDTISYTEFLTNEELEQYSSEYDALYGAHYNKDETEERKLLTAAYRYALEKGMKYIFLPESLQDISQGRAAAIYAMMSVDTPLIEQNQYVSLYTNQTVTRSVTIGELPVHTMTRRGKAVWINNFSPEYFAHKKEAVEEGRKVVADMPRGLDEAEKVWYLYRYVCDNVDYADYARSVKWPEYLYDAMIKGKSNCDGFSNAMSLLLFLADIDNYEVMSVTGEEGHTWNVVCIDGKYYMLDCTMGSGNREVLDKIGFGLTEDMVQSYYYQDKLPHCKEDTLAGYDGVVDVEAGWDKAARELARLWKQSESDTFYVKVKGLASDKAEQLVEDMGEAVNENIYISYYVYEYDTCCLLYILQEE